MTHKVLNIFKLELIIVNLSIKLNSANALSLKKEILLILDYKNLFTL